MKQKRIFIIVAVVALLLIIAGWRVYSDISNALLSFEERFRLSRPALDAYPAQVKASGPASLANPPSTISYFNVLKVEPLPHGFLFQSDYGNPFDWGGIAYSTEPLPKYAKTANHGEQVFEPIEGNWYTVFRP
ncbi:MAG: hypothetical protein K8S99_00105 [Planctomycetes bacterium]|nr:hypothetical protein [Planctomycetota bacterium]